MKIEKNHPLFDLNTFGLSAKAKRFSVLKNVEDLPHILDLKEPNEELLILGGGSNILFTKDYPNWILKNEIKGIEVLAEDADFVHVKVGSGEIWHQFVLQAIKNGWGGVENLSLIPGTVGAAPIQNIGAYGVEIKEVLTRVNTWNLQTGAYKTFLNEDCHFGYRDSIFKREYRGKLLITSVELKLSKHPMLNLEYGSLKHELEGIPISQIDIKAVSDAVIRIRQSKLPDPKVVGNAGSFFKNPYVTNDFFIQLAKDYPEIPHYIINENTIKLPAAWLIQQCGWKGYRKGDCGVHPQQALVLVNYGKAKGAEIFQLSEDIIESVQKKFGIRLEREVWVF